MSAATINPLAVVFGRLVQKRRQQAELSQSKLAKLSGISLKYLGEIERGEANVTIEVMGMLSHALHWNPFEAQTMPQEAPAEWIDVRRLARWLIAGRQHLGVIERMTERTKRQQAIYTRGRPKSSPQHLVVKERL